MVCELKDLEVLWRPLLPSEQPKALALIPQVEALLCEEARRVGKDLRSEIAANEDLRTVFVGVVVDVVARTISATTDTPAMTQFSQSAGGYSVSGSYLVPGGGIFVKKSEYARLGLRRQRMSFVDLGGEA